MVAENIVINASGLVTTADGISTFAKVLLCGVAAGSVVVPIAVKADGSLVTSGA